ncbi:unnamed protein product [Mytilus edulis]|uniref:Reverse transcriptase domain-containing protein n=1 Tax=Mytilus edulis TaxID=6550 RepID=A0A8S3S6R4_MYTED|nr:unnamed protein product [Mytilus edulis]
MNTSQHDPVMALVKVSITAKQIEENNHINSKKINWEKVNRTKYQSMLYEKFQLIDIDNLDINISNVNIFTEMLCNIIDTSAKECAKPNKQKSRPRKRYWPDEIKKACCENKHHFWKWKMAGRPRDQENIHFRNMKNGKRKLRSTQRQLEAVARKQKFENIMTAREGDQKLFFKLVNDQRRTGMEKTTQLKFKNGIYDNPDSIRKGWAEYFEELATPSSSNYEDVLYNNQVELDCLLFEDTYTSNLQNSEKFLGKAADCANLTSEHLKNGGQIVISAVTKLINMIFDVCSIPDLLKLGIATPVYKRKGKPLDDPNSYRKITVTSILNKILEKLYLEKKDETLKNAQSPLQRGFTKGISGLNAALILNELIAEAQDLHRPLYVAFLDAQKAFDLVWHSSLLRKLHQSGIESDSWLMFKEWYKDLTSQIKWEGDYANKEHYCISKTKSSVVQFNDKQPRNFTMNSEEIPTSQSAVHLGIERDNSSKFGTKNVSNARISAARKATYALMGAGLHGLNGLNPTVSIHIIRIFIIPRLIHGLEVVRLMISDIKALSSYFKQLLKRIQHLPERTADSATYLLSGQMPIEAEIDKRTLTLFGNIIRNPNTVEFKLAQRQLAIKDRNSKSWFTYVQQLLEKYNLPLFISTSTRTTRKILMEKLSI